MPTYAECMRHDKNDLIMLGKYRLFRPGALLCTAKDQRTKSEMTTACDAQRHMLTLNVGSQQASSDGLRQQANGFSKL